MAQRVSGYERQVLDVYETPAWVTKIVVPYLKQHALRVWDPANGPSSKIAAVLKQEGFRTFATNDDFLACTELPDGRVDAVVTNPPYGLQGKLACEFIEHALVLVPVVAMLLRVDFDSGKTRQRLFGECKAFDRKIVLLDRIVWFEREGMAGPSDNHAWFSWRRNRKGPPTIHYACKER